MISFAGIRNGCTPGASAAKLHAVVDQAAGYARWRTTAKFRLRTCAWAMHGYGGKYRPQIERVERHEVVVAYWLTKAKP